MHQDSWQSIVNKIVSAFVKAARDFILDDLYPLFLEAVRRFGNRFLHELDRSFSSRLVASA